MPELNTLQRALITIKRLKEQLAYQPIAIVGMSCRFPGASNLHAYWELLTQGKSVISQYPQHRWDLLQNTNETVLRKKEHAYWGSFLENITEFDAYFFGISPREALRMDPQQRLLLEVAYEAFEDAGLTMEMLAGSNTGVFASLYASQYAHLQQLDSQMDALYLPTGNASSIAANRLSFIFDLRGPSMVLDTACSSSLVALHTAAMNLNNKLCSQAIVCGVNINLLPSINHLLSEAKMLSPEGKCKTFSATADGYVPGEGVGAIILKPLAQALQDQDRIYAVINGSAINQDGKTNGLTAPNGLQQEQLLRTAYQVANINPQDVAYVECHGTGTLLGDPIELQALGKVISQDRTGKCWIGSVKTNIGHLEPAAGLASIIKTALSLHKNVIPAHLNCDTLNPHINFDKYHFAIPQINHAYPQSQRIAGVSGFGFGGANAHVVMSHLAQTAPNAAHQHKQEIFTISAKTRAALMLAIKHWYEFLSTQAEINLSQLCYNLHVRRTHYAQRYAIVVNTCADVLAALQSVVLDETKLAMTGTSKISLPASSTPVEIAEAYLAGATIDWKQYEAGRNYLPLTMPVYAWDRKHYWPQIDNKQHALIPQDDYPLRGKKLHSPLNTLQFEFKLDQAVAKDLEATFSVMHIGYYVEMLAFIAHKLTKQEHFCLEEHHFISPVFVLPETLVTLHVVLEEIASNRYRYEFYSKNAQHENWVRHAYGELNLERQLPAPVLPISALQTRMPIQQNADNLYERILAMGMPAGESIRWTRQFWRNQEESLTEFCQPNITLGSNLLYKAKLHPGVFDGIVQPLFRLVSEEINRPFIASYIKSLRYYGNPNGTLYLHTVRLDSQQKEHLEGNTCLFNQENEVIAEFENLRLTQFDAKYTFGANNATRGEMQKQAISHLPEAEREVFVTRFLRAQIAAIFSMPEADVDTDVALNAMGIDSLMALVLIRTLKTAFEVDYSMQNVLDGASIQEITNFILMKQADVLTQPESIWIAYRQRQANPKMRLFCFPYGGGGASIYRHWQAALPPTIEVCPIQMPGRESRMNEAPLHNLQVLITMLADSLQTEFTLPFAFFGHSFGALIAFELARELRRRQLPMPKHLFVSAFPDPRVPSKSLHALVEQLKTYEIDLFQVLPQDIVQHLNHDKLAIISNVFNDNGIYDYGDNLKNIEVSKALLPIFCGDMGIVKSYEFYPEIPLDADITVFAGKQDTWVAYEDHLQWNEHTNNKFALHAFDSGHMFIREESIKQEVLEKIFLALTA